MTQDEWLVKLTAAAESKGICPGCPGGRMCSQGVRLFGRALGYPLWAGYIHHPACTRPRVRMCPVSSAITGTACALPEGHPADSPTRFHRFPPKGAAK